MNANDTPLILICALVTCAVAQPVLGGPGDAPLFTDVATPTIAQTAMLNESLAWGDYDNDGDEDLYLTNNGANLMLRNDGGTTFTDVTITTGLDNADFSVGAAFADMDNDGDLDLYVVTFGTGLDVLYRNDGPVGPGDEYLFTDVTATAGTTIVNSSRGMALLDYNRDGLVDIYVVAIGEFILYENQGNLQFVDVAATLGVNQSATGVGVVCTDVDNNGWIDIYTGNRSGQISNLYVNTQGTFTDIAATAGITATGLGMGVLSFDFDNDLDMDLYWTTWPGNGKTPTPNSLYENVNGASFVDVAAASGTADPTGWGISCNAGDIDADGWMDFFVTNGADASTSPNVLFHNQANGTFTDVTLSALGGAAFDGRGVAFADFDDDGRLDLAVTADAGEPTRLWRNTTVNANHWITLKLVGTVSNRSAIGARVEVTTPLMTTVQEVSGGAGRGSQNSLPLEFGLAGATTIDQITLFWPNGGTQTLQGIAVDQVLSVIEPRWGDLNCDGTVNALDLQPFVMALLDPAAYAATYPDCDAANADLNGDAQLDDEDAKQFVQCLLNETCPF